MADPPWGVALGGGGLLCATELGVLRALAEWRLQPPVVAGSSGGGIVAGALACGVPLEGLISFLREVAKHPAHWGLGEVLTAARSLLAELPAPGLFTLRPILEALTAHGADRGIAEWPAGYGVQTTVLPAGRSCPITAARYPGTLSPEDAMQATSAFPGLFEPVRAGGCVYCDGGLLDNVPIGLAVRLGACRVLAVDLDQAPAPLPERWGLLQFLWRAVHVAVEAAQAAEPTTVPILYLRPKVPPKAWLLAFDEFDALLESGYQAAVTDRGAIETLIDPDGPSAAGATAG